MSRDFPVTGLADLDRYLSMLPGNLQKGAYRAGLTAAAKPVRDEARLRAHKKSGKMARAIKTGSPRQNQDGSFSVMISLKGEHAFIGFFEEYGVAPHLIAPKAKGLGPAGLKAAASSGAKVGGVMKIGDEFVSGIIHHPGHAAHPFLRPALDVKAEEAVLAFAARIRDYIEGKTGFAAPVDDLDEAA